MATTTAYMPVIGTPTLDAIITTSTKLELGMGVVPMDARVESKTTII